MQSSGFIVNPISYYLVYSINSAYCLCNNISQSSMENIKVFFLLKIPLDIIYIFYNIYTIVSLLLSIITTHNCSSFFIFTSHTDNISSTVFSSRLFNSYPYFVTLLTILIIPYNKRDPPCLFLAYFSI